MSKRKRTGPVRKHGGMEYYTAADMIEAIEGSGSILTHVAEKLSCTVLTVRRYIREYPTVRQAYEEERSRVKDMAESAVVRAIEAGDVKVAQWYLTIKAQDRGYDTQTRRIVGHDGGPVKNEVAHTVKVMIPDNGRLRVEMLDKEQREAWDQSVEAGNQHVLEEGAGRVIDAEWVEVQDEEAGEEVE